MGPPASSHRHEQGRHAHGPPPRDAAGQDGPGQVEQLIVAPHPSSVAAARAFVARVCARAGVGQDLQDSAVLLTSEVVANAVLHGRSEARVTVVARRTLVRVQVADENSRHPQRVAQDPDALDGRGLAIVDLLARAWGVQDDPGGKTVWFDVAT